MGYEKRNDGYRRCSMCGLLKGRVEYNKGNNTDGCSNYCKPCDRKRARESYKKNPDSVRNSGYLARYGINLDDLQRMLSEQNNCCAICYLKFNMDHKEIKPHVDHDHVTGKVRGILCNKCNNMLGCAKDSVDTLYMAIQYLERYGN